MNPIDCPRCPELIESVGALKAGQVFANNTLQNVSEKIDRLTMNGFSRDKHDAVKDAEHAVEQRTHADEQTALKGHGWGFLVAVAAGGAAGGSVLQAILPPIFKFLAGVIK